MNKFIKNQPCSIPLLFMLVYGILILALVPFYSNDLIFVSRILGLVAFINVFTQVMLGVFRQFFNTYYNPGRIFKLHNILGTITLVLVYVHAMIMDLTLGLNFVLSLGIGIITAIIAVSIMSVTVISSDLKFYFKVNIKPLLWRFIHYFNYILFPLLVIHELMLGFLSRNYVALLVLLVCTTIFMIGVFKKAKKLIYLQ